MRQDVSSVPGHEGERNITLGQRDCQLIYRLAGKIGIDQSCIVFSIRDKPPCKL
jgi:hypothetical protein